MPRFFQNPFSPFFFFGIPSRFCLLLGFPSSRTPYSRKEEEEEEEEEGKNLENLLMEAYTHMWFGVLEDACVSSSRLRHPRRLPVRGLRASSDLCLRSTQQVTSPLHPGRRGIGWRFFMHVVAAAAAAAGVPC
jgi:hypothetical protein